MTDFEEELLVVDVEEDAELVAESLTQRTRTDVHLERHLGELSAVVGRHQPVAVSADVVGQRQSVQSPRSPVQLDPRLRRHGQVVVERHEDQLQVARVAFFRVVERAVRYREPQHVADARLSTVMQSTIPPYDSIYIHTERLACREKLTAAGQINLPHGTTSMTRSSADTGLARQHLQIKCSAKLYIFPNHRSEESTMRVGFGRDTDLSRNVPISTFYCTL